MATTVDADVVTALTGSNGLVSGTNLFAGPVRAPGTGVPDKAVFVLATGGPPPMPFILGGSGTDYCRSTVQVRVRSDQEDFPTGQTLARALRTLLHKNILSGYIDVRVRESEPNYLGQGELGHHEWSINLEMEHRR